MEVDTKEYMVDGWDRGPTGCHPYKRGSRHNRIGMWVMWIFYGIITVQIVHLLTVLPWIFDKTGASVPAAGALMGTGLALAGYVVLRVNWE